MISSKVKYSPPCGSDNRKSIIARGSGICQNIENAVKADLLEVNNKSAFLYITRNIKIERKIHHEHHYRYRPRLLCHQNSPLLVSGWADKLRRTRTLHPPRTLRVWRVLFCLWLRAAAYPAGQDGERQLLPADAGGDCQRNSAARSAARVFGAHCGGSAADRFWARQTQVQRVSAAEQAAGELQVRGRGVQHHD